MNYYRVFNGFKQFRCILMPFSTLKSSISIRKQSTYIGKTFKKFRVKDKIHDDNFELIYRNPATNYVNLAKLTSIVIGASFPVLLFFISNEASLSEERFGPSNFQELLVAASGLYVTCFCLYYVGYKSPVRIYSNGKKFIMIKSGVLGDLTSGKHVEFIGGECSQAVPTTFTIFKHCRHSIQGKVYYIYDNHFKTSADYYRMIGSQRD